MDFEEHYTEVEILAAAVKPPSPVRQITSLPELISLLTGSRDRLFFVAFNLPGSEVKEWKLVRIAYNATMKVHPNFVVDGTFMPLILPRFPQKCKRFYPLTALIRTMARFINPFLGWTTMMQASKDLFPHCHSKVCHCSMQTRRTHLCSQLSTK